MAQFYELFSEYIDKSLLNKLSFGRVTDFKVWRKTRTLEFGLYLNELVDFEIIDKAQSQLSSALKLNKTVIKIQYSKSLFDIKDIQKILSPMKYSHQVVNGFFDGVEAELEDGILTVCLKKGGKDILEAQNIASDISKLIYDMFDIDLDVSFMEVEAFDIDKAVREAAEQKRKEEAEKEKELKAKKLEEERNAVHELWGDLPIYKDTRKSIFGRGIREMPKPISEVTPDDGYITVWGDVFSTDSRNTKRGDNTIFSFDISDYTSSISCKMFDKNSIVSPVKKAIEEGGTLVVFGAYQFDNFSNQFVLRPMGIEKVMKAEKTDDAEEKRVELHLHTSQSEMDAMTPAKKLIERAAKWGHKAIAVTDHGVVQALPEAYGTAKKNGIKLILGMEGYLVDDSLYPDFMNMKRSEFKRHHIILLVKEDTSLDESIPKEERKYGRKNLYEMISHSNVKTYKYRPLIPKSLLLEKRDGLIIGSACEQGELFQAMLNEKSDEEIEKLAELYDYVEIQPTGNNAFMLRTDKEPYNKINSESDIIEINKKLIDLADRLGKPVVATGDVHFLDKKDAKLRAIIMASKGFDDADMQPPLYFKTTNEMLEDFAWAGDRAKEFVIDNPNKIADMIQDDIPPIPPGTFQPYIEGADDELREKCWSMAKDLYGDPVPEYVASRLTRELDSIISNGYGVLYVIAKRLVEHSEKLGYLVGSRGSVGSSLAAHFGGISEVNPLAPHYYCKKCKHSEFFTHGEYGSGFDLPPKNCPECGEPMKRDGHEIPFETFLGFEGDKEPDIDLNFSGEVQGRIHHYTEEIFGEDYVFKAGTIATVAAKTAYGYIAKYLEERELLNVTPKAEIDRLVLAIDKASVKRTTGQHPGGMVVVPDKYTVEDFTPVQFPSNDESKGTYTTHYDFKKSLHDTLLKLDELGHDNPTIYKYLEDATGVPVMDVDLSDPKLYELITSTAPINVSPEDIDCETGTLAIPEMGTPFVIGMLTEAKPKNFADLLQISGLSHGTDVWLGNAQELIEKGICTISEVIGCRDDIMTYLIHKAEKYEKETGNKSPLSNIDCFDIMEKTRKGLAEKFLPPYEEAMKTIGVEQWYIDSCYKIKYMFPKAHAAAYVIAALRIAWYKIYYPLEFYSAYFTVRGGAIDALAAVQGKEAVKKKMQEIKLKGTEATQKEESQYVVLQIVIEMLARGFEFLPVDLNKSDWRIYKIEDGKIRLPYSSIDGIGETAAKSIADAVERNPEGFIASDDLANEPGVGKSVVDALRSVGALGDLPETRQISLF
ncbi:MAG: PolC-type DNA polymerase III [Eubacterium sp.]|nr:PolC-type DNA polymerase III [Eubacterium sp.]